MQYKIPNLILFNIIEEAVFCFNLEYEGVKNIWYFVFYVICKKKYKIGVKCCVCQENVVNLQIEKVVVQHSYKTYFLVNGKEFDKGIKAYRRDVGYLVGFDA